MTRITTLVLFAFISCNLLAQQETQYTQFMYNKLALNPAYAGTPEAPTLQAVIRSQWLGVEGAPNTQILSFSLPLAHQRIGLGMNISRHTISIYENITLDMAYAYRFPLGHGYLGLGVQGSLRSLAADFTDPRLIATQPITTDPSIPATRQQKYLFNVGSGIYYEGEHFYLGFSVPRILQNNIDFNTPDDLLLSIEIPHAFLMGGASFVLNDQMSLQPQILLKYVSNAPLDADINVSLNILNKYLAGLTYRLGGSSVTGFGESLDVILAAQLSPKLLFSVSYDLTLSGIKDFSTGSVEAMLRYSFGRGEAEEYINPRFF